MNVKESLRIALGSLLINRMRAALTTLGIVIGVGAVISLVGLGRGVEAYVSSQFEGLGADILTVMQSPPSEDPSIEPEPLTDEEGKALMKPEIAPNVAAVVMIYNVSGTLVNGSESLDLTVVGVTPNYSEVNDWQASGGRFITQEDLDDNARVIVLGVTAVEELFGSRTFNPIGLSVEVNGRMFEVVGVMEEKSSDDFGDQNETAFVPITTAQSRLDNARVRGGAYQVSQLQAQAASEEQVDAATNEIDAYLRQAHGIVYEGYEDYSIRGSGEILDTVSEITSLLTAFLGMIAGISLLVGGIGIMNIMLVSVTERTREIGLRKAVGAQAADILSQFLIESLVLSLLGGAIGVLVGWVVMIAGSALVPDLQLGLTGDAVALATGVSGFIGIFFGLYPASRAARMRPIDALRFE